MSRDGFRKANIHMDLNLGRNVKGNKNVFSRYKSSKRKTSENVDSLLNGAGGLVTKDMEKAEVLHDTCPLSLVVRTAFRYPRLLR